MINIIKDISKKYISTTENVIVKNIETYFLAREMFFKNYHNSNDFEIIIKNKGFFPYFLDLEEYNYVNVKEITEDSGPIINLGPDNNIFEVLLNAKDYESNPNIINILEKEYLKNYKYLLSSRKKSIDEYIYELVKSYVFSKYKEHNFNILMGDEYLGFYNEIQMNLQLEESFITNKELLREYILSSNIHLKNNFKKICLFSDIPGENYLQEIFGELEFEQDYFFSKNIEKLNFLKNYNEIFRNIVLGEEKFSKNYNDIKKLLVGLIEIEKSRKLQKDDIEKWKEFFTQYYIKYNNLSEKENIINQIESIEKKYSVNLNSLKMGLENIWNSINLEFENFYIRNYEELYSSNNKAGLDYAISKNYKYLTNKRNIFLFIDCLRYDIWKKIKTFIMSKGYNCHHEEVILSAIPTVTSYCKKILYTGKKFNHIENSDLNTPLSVFSYNNQLKKIESLQEISLSDSENFLFEILDLDYLFHNIKDLSDEYLEQNLELKLKKLFEHIDINNFNIIVMTDHGAMRLNDDNLIQFKEKEFITEKGLKIENHGRYLKVYGSLYDDDLYITLNNSLQECKNFYVINRGEMSKFYLPTSEKEKENYFYLISKYGKYPKKTSEFNHGGISLEEVMIPFGIFSTEKKEYIPIEIEIKSKEIENNTKAEIEILFKNKNIIENLKIRLKYQEQEHIIKYLEDSKILQFPLTLDSDLTGELKDTLEISFTSEGKEYYLKESICVKIIKNKIKEFNNKIKKSRSLL